MAAVAAAPPAAAATSASRSFRILRSGSDIGTHTLDARLDGGMFEIGISITIAVKILGITVYRYELENRERWKAGKLISLDSRVNDDGAQEFARAFQEAGSLVIEGSGFTGTAPDGAATTSYFADAFLGRTPWISTQTGRPLDVRATDEGGGWWRISGDMEKRLRFDERGEWVSSEFDAGGTLARYETVAESGRIAELWRMA